MKRAVFVLAVLFTLAHTAAAQIGGAPKKAPADPRVRAALEQLGYKYELTEENEYRLFPIETEPAGTDANGKPTYRSQLVYINSATEPYGTLEIREVWSPAFLLHGAAHGGARQPPAARE